MPIEQNTDIQSITEEISLNLRKIYGNSYKLVDVYEEDLFVCTLKAFIENSKNYEIYKELIETKPKSIFYDQLNINEKEYYSMKSN